MKPPSQKTAGELVMLRLVAPRWSSSLEQQLQAVEPGGILLAGPRPQSPETLYELLAGLSQSLHAPPILALEAEDDNVDLLSVLLPPLPSLRAMAEKGGWLARQAGEMIGEALKLLGFNTHFAIALDRASGLAEEVLGAWTFSANPRVVAECGASFVEGLSRLINRARPCSRLKLWRDCSAENSDIAVWWSPRSLNLRQCEGF